MNAELVRKLRAEVEDYRLTIAKLNDNSSMINMNESVLFDSGDSVLKQSGKDILQKVGETLNGMSYSQMNVIGHTDDIRIGKKLQQSYPTNWELSSARATAVVRYLVENVAVDATKVAATGRSKFHPVADNNSAEGRVQNRRVEFCDSSLISS